MSGKRLLAALRAALQDQFGVNFGNERLAEEFEASDLHDEIKHVLEEAAALQAP